MKSGNNADSVLFKASLAEILVHMVLNCEDEEKEVNNEEEGEISCNLVKCHVCACEEVKNTFRDTK